MLLIWHTYCRNCQLGFSSKIKVPRLGSAWYFHSSARLEPENSSSNSSLVNSPFITLQTMAFNHNSFQWFKSASNVFSLLNRKFRTHFGISILFDFLKVWGYRLQGKLKINLANYVNTQNGVIFWAFSYCLYESLLNWRKCIMKKATAGV